MPDASNDIAARAHWQSAERAALYRRSREPGKFGRYWREEAQLARWMADLPRNARVLDAPCGTGRWIPHLAGRGFAYVGMDVSASMVGEARQLTAPPAVMGFAVGDATRLPFADDSFDCVIVWRFIHHLATSEMRRRVLREAARVSRRRVIVSFHHVLSLTYLTRFYLRRRLFGFEQDGRGTTARQIAAEAADAGLRVAEFDSFGKYRSINWFAKLEREKER